MNEGKISIPLHNGWKLCVECGTEPYDRELYVFIEDPHGVIWQDLAVVRNSYAYNPVSGMPMYIPGLFDLLIYTDPDSEDYTVSYRVPIQKEEP